MEVRERHRGASRPSGRPSSGAGRLRPAPGPGGEARAVEPLPGRLAAPHVGDAELATRPPLRPPAPPAPRRWRGGSGHLGGRRWEPAAGAAAARAWSELVLGLPPAAASLAWAAASAGRGGGLLLLGDHVAIWPFTWLSALCLLGLEGLGRLDRRLADGRGLRRLHVLLDGGTPAGPEHVLGGVEVIDGGGELPSATSLYSRASADVSGCPRRSGSVAAAAPCHVGVEGRLAQGRLVAAHVLLGLVDLRLGGRDLLLTEACGPGRPRISGRGRRSAGRWRRSPARAWWPAPCRL